MFHRSPSNNLCILLSFRIRWSTNPIDRKL